MGTAWSVGTAPLRRDVREVVSLRIEDVQRPTDGLAPFGNIHPDGHDVLRFVLLRLVRRPVEHVCRHIGRTEYSDRLDRRLRGRGGDAQGREEYRPRVIDRTVRTSSIIALG